MKHSAPVKALILGLSCLLCALYFTACKVNLKSGDNGLYDKKNDVTYCHASPTYEAISLGKEYGKLTVTDKESYTLYLLPGVDPTEMLATEDFNIVYSSEIDLPTLTEMAPTLLRVCNNSLEIKRIEDVSAIASIVSHYVNGTSIDYPGTTPIRTYKLRFESPLYPSFYYTVTYVEYDKDLEIDGKSYGRYFLYNSFDRYFVPTDDTIHNALGIS